VTEYSLWRAIDPAAVKALTAQGAPIIVDGRNGLPTDLPAGTLRIEQIAQKTYYWELVGTQDLYYQPAYGRPIATHYDSTGADAGVHYFQIVAQTADPMVFWASDPDSGYSVDNLAPCPPQALAGVQTFDPLGLGLRWRANTEPDLDCYRVYRGASEEFVPAAENLIATPCDTAIFDSGVSFTDGYWYKVAAVDVHGNASAYAVLGPDGVTGAEPPAVPQATFLEQNAPNPFNPRTLIRFGVSHPGRARIAIYDAGGRLVRLLFDEDTAAGRYRTVWDGCDDHGRALASGLYLCRLVTDDVSQTRKLLLMR
jgi:hypothetical protein